MPRRYKKRKSNTWKRKRSVALQPRSPIADSQIVKLKYGELTSMSTTAGLAETLVFSANNCNDPRTAAGGHQPMGFDEWMQFYNHYTVLGSRVRVTYMPSGSGVNNAALVSIKVQDDYTVVGTINDSILEQTGVVWKAMGGDTSNGSQTLTKYFSAKKFFGVSDVMDNHELSGRLGADPSEQAYYHVTVSGVNGSAVTVNFAIQIEYIVRLHERKTLLQS